MNRFIYPDIVACCGTFDGNIHQGHVNFFQQAQELGQLHIGVVPGSVVRKNKDRDPMFSQLDRIKNIRALGLAVEVIALGEGEEIPLQQMVSLSPSVYCFGEDQTSAWDRLVETTLTELFDTRIVRIPRYEPERYSTTQQHFTS